MLSYPNPVWSAGNAQVWQLDLDAVQPESDLGSLSADERERAGRFAFEHLRKRFLAGRAFVRRALGDHLACAPAELSFGKGLQGKPFVQGMPDLQFNLSHSQNVAVLAIAACEVGVDVEVSRTLSDASALARRLYQDDEREWVESIEGPEMHARFLTCWTRKEACIKAVGSGLSIDPKSFNAGPGNQARRADVDWNGRRITVDIHGSRWIDQRWVISLATVGQPSG